MPLFAVLITIMGTGIPAERTCAGRISTVVPETADPA